MFVIPVSKELYECWDAEIVIQHYEEKAVYAKSVKIDNGLRDFRDLVEFAKTHGELVSGVFHARTSWEYSFSYYPSVDTVWVYTRTIVFSVKLIENDVYVECTIVR